MPHLLYYKDNKSLFIKQHINFMKLLHQLDNSQLPLLNKNLLCV